MLKKFLQEYFTFTRSERNGLIILLSLLLLLLAARASIPYLFKEQVANFDRFEDELALFESSLQFREEAEIPEPDVSSSRAFYFDPNQAGENDLAALGLDRFVISNIVKYREMGGRFSSAQDLKKIYGMKDEAYLILEPFILIEPGPVDPEKQDKQKGYGSSESEHMNQPDWNEYDSTWNKQVEWGRSSSTRLSISLNQADSSQLIGLPGIGPVLSGRILRYRELLGGYYNKEQLLEVYQLTPERFERISDLVCIDTQNITMINVNHIMSESIPYHPYINEYQFRAIIKFRDLYGSFERIEDITENRLLPDEVYEKVKPYLVIE